MNNSDESVEEIELVEQEEIEVEEDDEDDSDGENSKKETQKKSNNEVQKENKVMKEEIEDNIKTDFKKEIKPKNNKQIQKENKIINKETEENIQNENKFNEIINQSKEIDNLINESNLELKIQGYIKLRELFINSDSNIIAKNFDLFFVYIQDKLKNFQETNVTILKEGIECLCSLFKVLSDTDDYNVEKIDKKYLNVLLNELYEKINFKKIKNSYTNLLNLLIDTFSGLIFFDSLFQILSEVDKISTLIEYSIFIKNYLSNINLNTLNKKINTEQLIEFCINITNDENPQLKTISTEIINIIYNYLDDSLKKYLKDNGIKTPIINNKEKKSFLKNYMTENNYNDNNFNKNIDSDNDINNENENDNNNYNNTNFNERDDISFEITPKLLKDINIGNWNEKKDGIEYIHEVLNSHGNYVLINGLNDLIELIIDKLLDPNKNFVRIIIELLTHLIESLGSQLKPYTKAIIEPLLTLLSNKNNLIRQECVTCIKKWIKIIQNFGIVCSYIPQLLLNENFDMRNELLNILIDNNSLLNNNISNIFYNDINYSLLICLQDKSSTIRNKAEKIITNLKSIIKEDDYIKNCQKFKQAISDSLEQIIKNIYRGKNNKNKENNNNHNNKRTITDCNNNNTSKNSLSLTAQKTNIFSKKKFLKKEKNSNNKNTKGINFVKTANSFMEKTTPSLLCNTPKVIQIKNLNKTKVKNVYGCTIDPENSNNITPSNNLTETPNNKKLITVNKKHKRQPNTNNLILTNNQIKSNKIRKAILFKEQADFPGEQRKNKFSNIEKMSKHKSVNEQKRRKNASCSPKKKIENILLKNIKIENLTNESINTDIFLENYKIKQGLKLKRLEEDKKSNFYFERNNFDYLPKIKDLMKGIFTSNFITNLYSDNVAPISNCVNQLTNYLLNEESNTIIKNSEINFKNVVENFDLLLKVIGEKITNSKTSSITISFLDFIKLYLKYCKSYNVEIHEVESNILLNIFTDNLINSTNIIREASLKMIFELNEMIGMESTFLTLIHLYDYKNTKTKIEIINVLSKLYLLLLQESGDNYTEYVNQFKIKIAKNMIQIYCDLEVNQKNKFFFIIKDMYTNFKNEFLKICKNIKSKKKDELLKELQDKSTPNKNIVKTDENIYKEINNKSNIKKNFYKCPRQNLKGKELVKMKSTRTRAIKTGFDDTIKNISSKNFIKATDKTFNKNNDTILNRTDNLKASLPIKNNNNLIAAIKEINKKNRKKSAEIIRISKNKIINNPKNPTHIKRGEDIRTCRLIDNKNCLSSNNLEVKKLKQGNTKKNIANSEAESKENVKNIVVNLSNKKAGTKIFDKERVLINSKKNSKFTEIKNMLEDLNSWQSSTIDTILKLNAIFYTNYDKNKTILVQNSDYIFNSLVQSINILLNEEPVHIKFLKFILDMLCKLCNKKEMLSSIQIDTHSNLIFIVLKNISIIDNNQDEHKIINKCLNSIMLKIIDFCNVNQNICLFIQNLKMNLNRNEKILDYCLKCLILIHENINHFINKIDASIFLENIYNLLGEFIDVNGKLIIDTKYEKIIVIVMRNIIDDLISVKGKSVYKEYTELVEKKGLNDKIIVNWILESLNKIDTSNAEHSSDEEKEIYCENSNKDNNKGFNVHNRNVKRENEGNEYKDSINSEFVNSSNADDNI